jgi:branched-chain amino acid transport system ATP-binding protein
VSLLSLRDVVAGYGGGDVLRGVDLDLDDGAIACIVGPNGAGKSTVLRVVTDCSRRGAGR